MKLVSKLLIFNCIFFQILQLSNTFVWKNGQIFFANCPNNLFGQIVWTESRIFTVQGVIVVNALIFMQKKRHFQFALPHSVRETIANNAPIPGSNCDTSLEWLTNYKDPIYLNLLFFKGPLLSIISELITPPSLNLNVDKKFAKKLLLTIQSCYITYLD